jgi:hypothetical protein
MSKFDELIGQALTQEDRALLASHAEPNFLAQASGVFRGPMGWLMGLANAASGIAFLVGAYALCRMIIAADALLAVKWGVGTLVLFQVTTLCKTLLGNRMEANRMLRELKRVELQLALLRADADTTK